MAPNLWSSGSAVQTTPHSARNDCHPQQPADFHNRIPGVRNVEVGHHPKDLRRREGSPVSRVELEPLYVVPTPRSGENLFCFASLRIQVLTDHEQIPFAARVIMWAETPSRNLAQQVFKVNRLYAVQLTPYNSKSRSLTTPLVQPGLGLAR